MAICRALLSAMLACVTLCHSSKILGIANLSAIPCPKVFVYEDFPTFAGGIPPHHITAERAYGPALSTPGLYATEAFSFGEILFNRLYRSEHCKVTRDPAAADLFLVSRRVFEPLPRITSVAHAYFPLVIDPNAFELHSCGSVHESLPGCRAC